MAPATAPLEPASILAMRLRCRDWYLRAQAALASLDDDSREFVVAGPLSRDEFMRRFYYRNRPACFPELAAEWPAMNRWNADYLIEACGSAQVEVMMHRNSMRGDLQYSSDHLRTLMPLAEYVSLVYSARVTNDYYIVSRNLFFERSETRVLLHDVVCPPFVRIDDEGKQVRMWLGPAGTVTPLHFDDRNSLLVQIGGRKRIRLYAPHCGEHMRQAVTFYGAPEGSPVAVPAGGTTLDLQPGDALFIPVGWWHSVVALDISISLSFTDFDALNEFGNP
jgi:hypothetical protein